MKSLKKIFQNLSSGEGILPVGEYDEHLYKGELYVHRHPKWARLQILIVAQKNNLRNLKNKSYIKGINK
jgi:hypothetical protein